MTDLVSAYQKREIREFERILRGKQSRCVRKNISLMRMAVYQRTTKPSWATLLFKPTLTMFSGVFVHKSW